MSVSVKTAGGRSSKNHGRYIWEKYKKEIVANPWFEAAIGDMQIKITDANFIISKIADFTTYFDGFYSPSFDNLVFTKEGGNLYLDNARAADFDRATGTLFLRNIDVGTYSARFQFDGAKEYGDNLLTFAEYVVADRPDAYPNNVMETGGFYYVKSEKQGRYAWKRCQTIKIDESESTILYMNGDEICEIYEKIRMNADGTFTGYGNSSTVSVTEGYDEFEVTTTDFPYYIYSPVEVYTDVHPKRTTLVGRRVRSIPGDFITVVVSDDANRYPEQGVQDMYYYEKIYIEHTLQYSGNIKQTDTVAENVKADGSIFKRVLNKFKK